MESFYSNWRRRFAVHAALLLLLSIAIGFEYRKVLQLDDHPLCPVNSSKQICQPGKANGGGLCEFDDPCLPDTVIEHRWRSAHQQGLTHALLLLGFAAAAPFFRVSRFIFAFAGWLLIIGVWTAPLGATVHAWGTAVKDVSEMKCLVTPGTYSISHCAANTLGAVAGISTTIAILILAIRSLWEALRDGVVPPTWRNWVRLVKARPRRIELPESETEIIEIVNRAIDEKTTVRAFGGRYSWSAIAPTDGVMIDMRRLRELDEPVPINPADPLKHGSATHTVRVMAGAQIRDLTKHLMDPSRKLMIQSSTVNPWVQIGGALANGCHGTGVDHKPLTDLVTSIEIIQAERQPDGSFVVATKPYTRPSTPPTGPRDPAWKEWRALTVNLGCLGVIYAVTFECVPLYGVHIVDTPMNMRTTIDSDAALREIIGHPQSKPQNRNRYAELFWFPFNDELFVRSWQPDDAATYGDFSRWFWLRQWFVAKVAGPVAFFVMGLLPFLTPYLMRIFHMAFSNLDARVRAPDAMQYERHFPTVYDMGYAVAYDPDTAAAPDGFRLFRKAWWQVVEKLENARHQGKYPQNLVLHVRFSQQAQGFLHPAKTDSATHYTAYMELVAHGNVSRHQEHFEAIERAWDRFGGKPHWGKLTYQPDRIVRNIDPDDLKDFQAVRLAMDPGQVFLNDYVRRVLRIWVP